MIGHTRQFVYFSALVVTLSLTLTMAAACGGGDRDLSVAVAVALTQTAAAREPSRPTRPAPTVDPGAITVSTYTPAPTQAPLPTPAPSCDEALEWVADLSFDDKNMTAPPRLAPGQAFVKSWRVRNNGTCAWEPSYSLAYVDGNSPAARMDGVPIAIGRPVAPGEEYDISVGLVAPTEPGKYQGFWQIRNGQGIPFGQRVWVGIEVPAPATPTPPPTQTPAPGIAFNADRTFIRAGESVRFSWKVENVQAVYFYVQGGPWQPYGVTGEGSQEVWPSQTTTYELRVEKRDGSAEVRAIRVDVEAAPDAPRIAHFSVEPDQIQSGEMVRIAWDIKGQVTQIKFKKDDDIWWDDAPVAGSTQDWPKASAVYSLKATGPGGTVQEQRYVTVSPSRSSGRAGEVTLIVPTNPNVSDPNAYLDLDTGVRGNMANADVEAFIRTSATAPDSYMMAPVGGALMADMGVTEPGLTGCQAATYGSSMVEILGQGRLDLSQGYSIYLCVRTNTRQGWAQVRIHSVEIVGRQGIARVKLSYLYWTSAP